MKIIYHNDLDGICAAAIFLRWARGQEGGDKVVEVIPMDYATPFSTARFDKGEKVVIVDYSLEKPGDMERLIRRVGKESILWFDHHDTHLQEAVDHGYDDIPGARFEGKEGDPPGCAMAWCHCYPDHPVPRAVELVGLYDVWEHEDTAVVPFHEGLQSRLNHPSDAMWGVLISFPGGAVPVEDTGANIVKVISEGHAILRRQHMRYTDLVKDCAFDAELTLKDELLPVLALNHYSPDGGSRALDSSFDPRLHACMVVFSWWGHYWRVSFYKNDEAIKAYEPESLTPTHLGELAKALALECGGRGGGRASAAGMTVPRLPPGLLPHVAG